MTRDSENTKSQQSEGVSAASVAMTPLERAKAGRDVTMSCAEPDAFLPQHVHCRGVVHWDGVPVGPCACECHKEGSE